MSQDVMTRKGYYDEMSKTFEDIHQKRDILNKEIEELAQEKIEIEHRLEQLQAHFVEADRNSAVLKTKLQKEEKLLKQLEAGGAIARAALRKQQLGSLSLVDRIASMRAEYRTAALEAIQSCSSFTQEVTVDDHVMIGPTGVELTLRCYIQSSTHSTRQHLPLITYFHGEGYVTGDLDTHDWICRSLAVLSGSVVAAVAYRQPPEARFPAAFEDAYAATCWISGGGLGWRPEHLAVAGDAAGGGLAVACCLQARDDAEGPRIHLQILFYPWLDLRPTSCSMLSVNEDNDAHLLQQEELEFFSETYAPTEPTVDDHDEGLADTHGQWLQEPRASPLNAVSLAGLPRAFIAYAADDLLSLDSSQYADRLCKESGPESVHLLKLQGPLGHGFLKFAQQGEAYAAIAAAGAFASGALRISHDIH